MEMTLDLFIVSVDKLDHRYIFQFAFFYLIAILRIHLLLSIPKTLIYVV